MGSGSGKMVTSISQRTFWAALVAAALVAAASFAGAAQAATYQVSTTTDIGATCSPAPAPCSLRQAVNAANVNPDFDLIELPAGTYELSLGQLTLQNTDATLAGAGAASTTIEQTDTERVIEVDGGNQVTISDVTITGGSGDAGAGVRASDTTLTIADSKVSGNTGTPTIGIGGYGAGVNVLNSTVLISGTEISDNRSEGTAGDTAPMGAGVTAYSATVEIVDSVVASNVVEGLTDGPGGLGGGISALNADLTVDSTTVDANEVLDGVDEAGGSGGGIFVVAGTLSMSDSTISNNTAYGSDFAGSGGGLVVASATASATNSTISGNLATGVTAGGKGGGVSVTTSGEFTADSSTIASNSAIGVGSEGGNLFANGDAVTIKNAIIADGEASDGVNCSLGLTARTFEGRNLESADTCGFGANGLVNTDPLLGPLQDNGGPTATRALLTGSPAIDAALDCPPPATDQRGVTRPQGSACDIGAFERVASPPGPGPGPGPTPDPKSAPALTSLRLAPARFRVGKQRSRGAKRKRASKGTRIRYTLSEAATTKFTIERQIKGRRSGKKCSTRKRKGRRCTAYVLMRGSVKQDGKQGRNVLRFSGRWGKKALRPGRYRLVATPSNSAGLGKPVRAKFRVMRRR